MNRLGLTIFLLCCGPLTAAVTVFGPIPYRQRSDSPFYQGILEGNIYLEDFEDGELNTPGVAISDNGRILRDISVDEDDGMLNGMAVLYRAHFQSMDVQLQLIQDGVPFMVTSGLKFFETAHIKDFSSFLMLAVNLRDESAFDRIVRMMPGIGAGTAAKMWLAWMAQAVPLQDDSRLAGFSGGGAGAAPRRTALQRRRWLAPGWA